MFDLPLSMKLPESLPLPAVAIAPTLARDIDELVASIMPAGKLTVVADPDTHAAFGERVHKALKSRFACALAMLPKHPAADDKTAEYIIAQAQGCDMLVAVGSGTINDLCKYAAAQLKKPYVVFPTAASMNGYLSANASITVGGYKKTIPAQMPKAVCCDMQVIAAAPARLSKSGLGDSLARPTAQADWLLSHLLLGTEYNELPFALLAKLEPELFDNARGIAKGDQASLKILMQTLLLSGLGMTIASGSYPASGGEHMIAHAMHMLKNAPALDTLHGEEIGVTTLTMAAIQQKLLRGNATIRREAFDHTKITALFGEHVAVESKKAFVEKQERMAVASRLHWQDAAARITPVVLPVERLRAILEAAEAPSEAVQLGWATDSYTQASACARYLRERFTFLDLC